MVDNGSEFVHLHTHSHYSLLQSSCTIDELVEAASSFDMPALALTDRGNMFATIDFYKKAKEAGIKPIIGAELYVAPGDMTEKNPSGTARENAHLTVLCKNQKGYRNLIKLVSGAYKEGFYYHPRVDHEFLSQHGEGLIGLSGCWQSEICEALRIGDDAEAEDLTATYRDIFGADDFYVELNRHGRQGEQTVIEGLLGLADEFGLDPVATNDVHYLHPDDALAQQVLTCIRTNTKLEEVTSRALPTDEFYFKSGEQMTERFEDIPRAIEATREIADRCDVTLELDEYHLPIYDEERDESEILRKRCEKRLEEKYERVTDEIRERLDHELSTISDMGFPGYFLIVQDLVEEARNRDIPVGPGRGSAAGCMVSYLLGITGIDPVEHNLIFERFLNPGRHEMPDIDIDFCKDRRDELIDFVKEKYGEERVTQIITFGSMKARAVIRDVGRVLGIPLEEVDEIAKLIPSGPGVTLEEAWENEPKLKRRIEEGGETYQRLWDLSKKLEGLNRNAGKHAAGVVIGDRPLTEYCPIFVSDKGETTQFDGDAVEEAGLLKMDFLGLKNLTVIENCLQIIEEREGNRPEMEKRPLEDDAVFELLCEGRTAGVFQLESEGMVNLCRRLQPDTFDDVIALLALYRPGPLDSGMADDYVERKHDPDKITYPHPQLQDILEPTYGVMIYQEQIMQAANKLAGFSLAEADKLRKAMGKKIPELLEKYREKFVSGAVENGVEEETADEIFDAIEKFGRYGFNRSHSAAYAMITMQTAFLKANYPVPYMAALLTSVKGNTDKVKEYIEDTRDMGIKVLPPDVNESRASFTVAGENRIRYGLAAIKQVGTRAAEKIVEARDEGDQESFRSIFDFCSRVDLQLADLGCLESLVEAGAFDSLHEDRADLYESLELASEYGARQQRNREHGQQSLFGGSDGNGRAEPELKNVDDWTDDERIAREKEAFGFYLDDNPLQNYSSVIRAMRTSTIASIRDNRPDGTFRIGGMVTETRDVRIQNGEHAGREMLIFTLRNLEKDRVECVLFPDAMEKYGHRVFEDSVILLEGEVRERNGEVTVSGQRVELAERALRSFVNGMELNLEEVSEDLLDGVRQVVDQHSGDVPLYLRVRDREGNRVRLRASREWSVSPSRFLLNDLSSILPRKEVSITTTDAGTGSPS